MEQQNKNIVHIPKEKFNFVDRDKNIHDVKFETKPRSYLHDAFSRFCKNKGSVVAAIVIICLVLFAIIVPIFTPYNVKDEDVNFKFALPKLHLFEKTSFWDGCKQTTANETTFSYYYNIGNELSNAKEGNGGHYAIKNQKYEINSDSLYSYRLDSYQSYGCEYKVFSLEEYKDIQRYQNETGNQVIYPMVNLKSRPSATQDSNDANYYYLTEKKKGKTVPVKDKDGNIILAYDILTEGEKNDPMFSDGYESIRIEGQDGLVDEDGEKYWYAYSRLVSGGSYELRINYYEYYIYKHTQVLKDGITEPYFILGATHVGKDVLTCLASGARFSFIFAIIIALINLVIGAIYGAIAGYYGGVTDLIMERVTDVLSAVPMMIVITLLKYHMKAPSGVQSILVLFLAFVATGWIGMAGTTRMQFYRFKNQESVLAARTLGAKDMRIIWKHIFPNAIGTLVTSCALVIPSMIFSETSLSYLGIIDLSTGSMTSVGTLIAAGQPYLTTYPHIVAAPSVFLSLLMLSFNLFGNGLRDAFNPSLRGTED